MMTMEIDMSETWEETKARLAMRGIISKHVVAVKARYDAQPVEQKALRVPRYNLVSTFNGVRKIVGFNLTIDEAEILKAVALKRLNKLPEPDAGGSPLFELTELMTEKVIDFGVGHRAQSEIDWK